MRCLQTTGSEQAKHTGDELSNVDSHHPKASHVRWLSPPPPWLPIVAAATGHTHTLPRFWDVGPHNCAGSGRPSDEPAWLGKVYEELGFAAVCERWQVPSSSADTAIAVPLLPHTCSPCLLALAEGNK